MAVILLDSSQSMEELVGAVADRIGNIVMIVLGIPLVLFMGRVLWLLTIDESDEPQTYITTPRLQEAKRPHRRTRKRKRPNRSPRKRWFEVGERLFPDQPQMRDFLIALDQHQGNLVKVSNKRGHSIEDAVLLIKSDPTLLDTTRRILLRYDENRYEEYLGPIYLGQSNSDDKHSIKHRFINNLRESKGNIYRACSGLDEDVVEMLIQIKSDKYLKKACISIFETFDKEIFVKYLSGKPLDKGMLDMSDEEYLDMVAEMEAQADSRVPMPTAIIDRSKLKLQTDMIHTINGNPLQERPRIAGFKVEETTSVKLVKIISSGGYVYLGGTEVGDTLVFERKEKRGGEKTQELTTDIMVPNSSTIQEVHVGQIGRLEKLLPKLSPHHDIVSMCYRFKPN